MTGNRKSVAVAAAASESRPACRKLEPEFHRKIWGTDRLDPWFTCERGENVGEVWYPSGDLLIKFLFTSADLSIQVHPDEEYARARGERHGKTEMWHVLRADPGARIALGFARSYSASEIVEAAQTGAIMQMLNWIEVQKGDTYFVPAGIVHAIGTGLAICEIQQNSDVTYRLYDYGRERELHLDRAREVMRTDVCNETTRTSDCDGMKLLVECPYFRTHLVNTGECGWLPGSSHLLVVLAGTGRVNGVTAYSGCVLEDIGYQGWFLEPERNGSTAGFTLLLVDAR